MYYIVLEYQNGEGNGTPLQYSCLENPTDGGAWWAAVHGVAKSRTRLSDFTFTFHFHALEKEMATHSSVLAWRIPGTGKPGGLLSMGSHRVGHDWSDLVAAAAAAALERSVHSWSCRPGRRGRHKGQAFSVQIWVAKAHCGCQHAWEKALGLSRVGVSRLWHTELWYDQINGPISTDIWWK